MLEKVSEVGRYWHDQFASSLVFLLVGIVIGIGQLLGGNERLTFRLFLGRALSTGGLAMAAGVVAVGELAQVAAVRVALS